MGLLALDVRHLIIIMGYLAHHLVERCVLKDTRLRDAVNHECICSSVVFERIMFLHFLSQSFLVHAEAMAEDVYGRIDDA